MPDRAVDTLYFCDATRGLRVRLVCRRAIGPDGASAWDSTEFRTARTTLSCGRWSWCGDRPLSGAGAEMLLVKRIPAAAGLVEHEIERGDGYNEKAEANADRRGAVDCGEVDAEEPEQISSM